MSDKKNPVDKKLNKKVPKTKKEKDQDLDKRLDETFPASDATAQY